MNSAVAKHAIRTDHNINWNDIKVLSICNSKNKNCVLESWFTKMLDSRMNMDQGTISSDYDCLVRKIKEYQNS